MELAISGKHLGMNRVAGHPCPKRGRKNGEWGQAVSPAGTLLQTVKTVEYCYPEPVRQVVTRLRLFPTAERGTQRLLYHEVEISPEPDQTAHLTDPFGNEVWEYLHAEVPERLQFTVRLVTEHRGGMDTACPGWQLAATHGVPAAGVGTFLQPSPLVDHSAEIHEAARSLGKSSGADEERVDRIGRWVYETMRFQSGVTTVRTPASEALAGRRGVCQDYAHIMLAVCRASGIPARYASGFIPSEGYMHAWVETLVADKAQGAAHWLGFDPTHDRRTDTQYVTVATGRDYSDISPLSGTFCGSRPGHLKTWTQTVMRALSA
jgi:transglutaminase-like putative cysteine protease